MLNDNCVYGCRQIRAARNELFADLMRYVYRGVARAMTSASTDKHRHAEDLFNWISTRNAPLD